MIRTLLPAPEPYLKPLPEESPENKEFFDGLDIGEFRVPRCDSCGDYNWVPYPACRTCLSEKQTWTAVSGDATVFSFTVVHRGPGAFGAEVPYVIVLGELVEQPRPCIVLGVAADTDPESFYVGMPIQIALEPVPSENAVIWRWVPR